MKMLFSYSHFVTSCKVNRCSINVIRKKTCVINDPLGQTHSLASSEHCFRWKFALFWKVGTDGRRVQKQWSLRAVTVGWPRGSISDLTQETSIKIGSHLIYGFLNWARKKNKIKTSVRKFLFSLSYISKAFS